MATLPLVTGPDNVEVTKSGCELCTCNWGLLGIEPVAVVYTILGHKGLNGHSKHGCQTVALKQPYTID